MHRGSARAIGTGVIPRAPLKRLGSMGRRPRRPPTSAACSRSFEPATHAARDEPPDRTATTGHRGMVLRRSAPSPSHQPPSQFTRAVSGCQTRFSTARAAATCSAAAAERTRHRNRVFHVKQSSLATRRGDIPPTIRSARSTRGRISAEPRRLCMPGCGRCLHGPPSSRRNHQPHTRQPLRWAVQQAAISTAPSSVRRDP